MFEVAIGLASSYYTLCRRWRKEGQGCQQEELHARKGQSLGLYDPEELSGIERREGFVEVN